MKQIHFFYLSFALLYCVLFVPLIGAVDKVAVHFLALSILSVLLSIFIFFIGTDSIEKTWKKLVKEDIIKYFIILIAWASTSIIYSKNISENIITFSEYFLYFLIIILLCLIAPNQKDKINLNILLFFPIVSLSIEEFYLIKDFLISTDYNIFNEYPDLKGIMMNKNIASSSLAIKIPIALYLFISQKNRLIRILLGLVVGLASFLLIIQSTRSMLLGLSLIISFSLFFGIFFKLKNPTYNLIFSIGMGILMGSYINFNTKNNIIDRFKTISFETEDGSVNQRIRYYKHGLNQILSNPVIGVGLGNWKIESIKYDSNDIKNYIVPYNLHNDFLEIGAELGLIGMVLYIGIFYSILIFLIKSIFKEIDINKKTLFISIFLCFMVYLLDANFNFPLSRTESQINFIFLTVLVLLIKHDKI